MVFLPIDTNSGRDKTGKNLKIILARLAKEGIDLAVVFEKRGVPYDELYVMSPESAPTYPETTPKWSYCL